MVKPESVNDENNRIDYERGLPVPRHRHGGARPGSNRPGLFRIAGSAANGVRARRAGLYLAGTGAGEKAPRRKAGRREISSNNEQARRNPEGTEKVGKRGREGRRHRRYSELHFEILHGKSAPSGGRGAEGITAGNIVRGCRSL